MGSPADAGRRPEMSERRKWMKAFDKNYKLLEEMYQDGYFPDFLVDKVKAELQKVIDLLERGETDREAVQEKLDEAVCAINDLQEEFDENDSEIETVARDCIGESVGYILEWFGIPIDVEEAIRERDW
jgi:exonuclease VII small subunit